MAIDLRALWEEFHDDTTQVEFHEWDSRYLAEIVPQYLLPSSSILVLGVSRGAAVGSLSVAGYEVTAGDFAVNALQKARTSSRIQNNGIDVDVVCADIRHLPFVAGSFQGVICPAILTHLLYISEIRHAAAHLTTVLAEGGFLFLSEPLQRDEPLFFYRNIVVPVYLFASGELENLFASLTVIQYHSVPEAVETKRGVYVFQRKGGKHYARL